MATLFSPTLRGDEAVVKLTLETSKKNLNGEKLSKIMFVPLKY